MRAAEVEHDCELETFQSEREGVRERGRDENESCGRAEQRGQTWAQGKASTPYLHWRDFTPYWKRHCSSASYTWPGAVVGYTNSSLGGTLFRQEPIPELQGVRKGGARVQAAPKTQDTEIITARWIGDRTAAQTKKTTVWGKQTNERAT